MTFAEFFATKPGRKSDKGTAHSFIEGWYSKEFTPRKDDLMNIVEIGVFKGDSIRLFRDYFPNANVIGIDPAPRWEVPGTIVEDGYDPDIVNRFPDGSIDYVIDDGPHTLETQLKAVELWLPKVKPGGKLIIEDIQDIDNQKKEFQKLGRPFRTVDLRDVKGRYDDVLLVFFKGA